MLERGERRVDLDVAIDRRDALEPDRGVGGDAGDEAGERQRPGLGTGDVEGRRLGDQAGGEVAVGLERGEGAEAAVLLGGHRLEHDVARRTARGGHRRHGVQRGGDRGLHVGRAASVQPPVLQPARPGTETPLLGALPDHVEVTVEAQPRGAGVVPGTVTVTPTSSSRATSSPGMVRMRAQRGEVVLAQRGVDPPLAGDRGEALHDRPLAAGHAGHLDQRRGVGEQRVAVERRERAGLEVAHACRSPAT